MVLEKQEQQLRSQRSQISQQQKVARQRKERLQSQARQIRQRESQLKSQRSLRGQDITGLAQRNQSLEQLSQTEQQIEERLDPIERFQSQASQAQGQIGDALAEINRIRRRRRKLAEAASNVSQSSIPEGAIGSAVGGGFLVPRSVIEGRSLVNDEVLTVNPISSTPSGVQFSVETPELEEFRGIQSPSISAPTVGQGIRGSIRESTGITLPSLRQTFELFTEGKKFEEPTTRDITAGRIIGSPLSASNQFSNIVAEAGGEIAVRSRVPDIQNRARIIDENFQQIPTGSVIGRIERVDPLTGRQIGESVGRLASDAALFGLAGPVAGGAILTGGGIDTLTKPGATRQERVLGVVETGIGLASLGFAGARGLTRERVLFRQDPTQTLTRTSADLFPTTFEGQRAFRVRLRAGGRQPARFQEQSSILDELIGRPSKTVEISPSQVRNIADIPNIPIIVDQEGNILSGGFASRREGATLTQLFGLQGGTQEFTLSQARQVLSPTEFRALVRGVGRNTGGIINIPEGANTQFFRGQTNTIRGPRISRSGRDINIFVPDAGRRVGRFSTVSAIQEVPSQSQGFRQFAGVTGSADITAGGLGTARRISRGRGRVRLFENVPGRAGDASEFTLATRRGLGLQSRQRPAVATARNIQGSAEQTLRTQLRRGARIRRNVVQPRPTTTAARQKLSQRSDFEIGPIVTQTQAQSLSPIQRSSTQTRSGLGSTVTLSQSEIQSVRQISQQLTDQFQRNRSRLIGLQGFAQPQSQTPAQVQRQFTRQLLAQVSAQKLRQRQITTQIGRQPTRTTARPTPKGIPPLAPGITRNTSSQSVRAALSGLGNQGVNVVTGFGKKSKIVASNLPKNVGLKTGLNYISKNIEASFRLQGSGRRPRGRDVRFSGISNQFRPSKRNALQIVEKKEFRLDSPAEKRQIKRARRRK